MLVKFNFNYPGLSALTGPYNRGLLAPCKGPMGPMIVAILSRFKYFKTLIDKAFRPLLQGPYGPFYKAYRPFYLGK